MNLSFLKKIFMRPVPFADPVLNTGCDFIEVNNWIISDFVVKRLVPLVGCHPFPLSEQMLMTAAVCSIKPTHILEWGTNIGVSARIFYEICASFSLAAEIHSVDLPDEIIHEEHPGAERGIWVRGIPNVILHQGDGLDVSLGILASSAQPIRPLFFLDGDHSYQSVLRELETIIASAPAASILIHDTFCQSVQSGYNTGPYRAIQDVLLQTAAFFEIHVQDCGLPGMTFLQKKVSSG
jgi:cephalosporin hydroxylase